MQIVIEIPESILNTIQADEMISREQLAILQMHILKGKPLPKGHGRLIDELDLDLFAPSLGTDEYVNDLMAKHNIDYVNGDDEDKVKAFSSDLIHGCMSVIETAPTIIEADKAGKEE